MRIEDHLWAREIAILPTAVDVDTFQYGDLPGGALETYKPNQGDRGRCHDLAAIQEIRAIRGSSARRIEQAGAFFLSADMRLALFDFVELDHGQRHTVAEVIPDRLLTTILWLKRPIEIKSVPLRTIIALRSRELLVDRDVWERFFATVEELRRRGDITQRDASILLYDTQVEALLKDVRRPDEVKAEWVMKSLEAARAEIDQEHAQEIEAAEDEFKKREEETQRAFSAKALVALEAAKAELRKSATRSANRWVGAFALLIAAVFLTVGLLTWSKFEDSMSG